MTDPHGGLSRRTDVEHGAQSDHRGETIQRYAWADVYELFHSPPAKDRGCHLLLHPT